MIGESCFERSGFFCELEELKNKGIKQKEPHVS